MEKKSKNSDLSRREKKVVKLKIGNLSCKKGKMKGSVFFFSTQHSRISLGPSERWLFKSKCHSFASYDVRGDTGLYTFILKMK